MISPETDESDRWVPMLAVTATFDQFPDLGDSLRLGLRGAIGNELIRTGNFSNPAEALANMLNGFAELSL